jgi:hypothetical protein
MQFLLEKTYPRAAVFSNLALAGSIGLMAVPPSKEPASET